MAHANWWLCGGGGGDLLETIIHNRGCLHPRSPLENSVYFLLLLLLLLLLSPTAGRPMFPHAKVCDFLEGVRAGGADNRRLIGRSPVSLQEPGLICMSLVSFAGARSH
jgi:hypothetical protein